jgi:YfiH family protein
MTQPQPTDGFEWTQAPWGAALRCRPLAAIAPHLFTVGNLQLRDAEDEWGAVARAVGVDPSRIRLLHQVHGVAVTTVRRGRPFDASRPEADIAISDDPQAAIGVRVADCAPVLIADLEQRVVGAAHAGWRGTLQGAAAAVVAALEREFGSKPADLVAAIGPCLGPCCGEVGPEVVEQFRTAGHDADDLHRWFKPGASGRPFLNLWRANRDQLEAAGVPADQIHSADLCTKTHAGTFHSYRAQGAAAGRMVAIIRPSR